MHLTDPNRPQINGRAAYGDPPIAVLPHLQVMPAGIGACHIEVMLAVGLSPLTFSWFHVTVPSYILPNLLERYRTNPEQTLFDTFKWTPPTQRSYHGFAKGVTSATPNPLADLEID